eukprot:GHVU01079773.1.p2 GENE.GHVU01079773.1~~GHVU01079773.1.p2  ORF type:complete len:106 (-),score=14.70 GHVU01079773.1:264-581(-)
MDCASTLEDLEIHDHEFVEWVPVDFRVLRKVYVFGKGANRWFASFAQSCTATLEELTISQEDQFVDQLPGSFSKLRKLKFRGTGAESCRVTVPETCVRSALPSVY